MFRGLIDRLLGSNEKLDGALSPAFGVVSRLSYDRYPGLLDLALKLLGHAPSESADHQHTSAVEAIFPVLDLLRRAPPPAAQRQHIRHLILKAVGSRHWHVRELASRTYAASIDPSELTESITSLLAHIELTQNELHGRLLGVRHLIMALTQRSQSNQVEQIVDIFTILVSNAPGIFAESNCEAVRTTFMDCFNAIYQAILFLPEQDLRSDRLLQALTYDSISTSHVLEGLPIHGDSLQQACELNAWLAHLSTSVLQRTVANGETPVGDLHHTVFTESADVDISALVLEKLTDMLQNSRREVRGLFIEALARFALQNPDMHEVCEHTLCIMMLADTKTNHDMVDNSGPMLVYLRRLDIASRFRNSISPLQAQQSLVVWGLVLAARWSDGNPTKGFIQDMQSWLSMIHSSLDENNVSHNFAQHGHQLTLAGL